MRKIKHISLNITEEIKKILPITLEKDLQDDEIICPVCHGLGIVKQDYRFGVKEDDAYLISKVSNNAEKKNKKSSKKVKRTESKKLYIYGDYEE